MFSGMPCIARSLALCPGSTTGGVVGSTSFVQPTKEQAEKTTAIIKNVRTMLLTPLHSRLTRDRHDAPHECVTGERLTRKV